MEITYDELERYLQLIFTGEKLCHIKNNDADIYVLFKQPTNRDKVVANFKYDMAYERALKEGILSKKEMERILYDRGLYTEEDDAKIEELRAKLKAQETILAKTSKVKMRADRLKGIISGLKDQIRAIEYKKFSKLNMCADILADEEKALYLCWACTYNIDTDERYWQNFDSFLSTSDVVFRNRLSREYLDFYGGIPEAIIRYIARSSLWRIRYVTSQKTSEALFGIPTSEYNNDILNLVYWSNYYQNIYDMMPEDRPSDEVIEDDSLLDAFMNSYYEKRSREDSHRRAKGSTSGSMSSFDKEEVIITQSNALYQDIKYDKPREAQRIKDKNNIKKKTRKPK